jgi:ribosomal protein S18 acetylase RimI-like enzyme
MTSGAVIEGMRASIRPLLNETSPADALASYYSLDHPPDRVDLFVHPDERPRGFLVRARTGMDLFRPLVTFRADDEATARRLFAAGLPAGRPVYLTVPERLALWSNKYLTVSDAELHRIYLLNALHEPVINVLVVVSTGSDGQPRCEIRSGDQPGAVAGVNWRSSRFAEVYVYTVPAARGRGWGKAVVSRLAQLLIERGRLPLYVVAESNEYSIRLAETVGFEDTGLREYAGQAIRPANPLEQTGRFDG